MLTKRSPFEYLGMIGIDLGTTNSLVTLFRNDNPEVLTNEMGESLTPSAVAVAKDGQVLVGRAAKDRLAIDPSSGITQFKRDMGTDTVYKFGKRKWTPTECSALILREMKRIAELHLGTDVASAVITVPAYFHDEQRNATIEAAGIAGLTVDRIINEPTAAALSYGYQNPDAETSLLVFDLGGGTFDVTLLDVFDGVIEVKASGGISHLGGEDFTDAFAEWIQAKHKWSPKPDDKQRWRQHIEMAKRRLSKQNLTTASVGKEEIELSYDDFCKATSHLTDRLFPIIRRCLSDANTSLNEIDDILLVGGATRSRNVLDRLATESQRIPNAKLDPDHVVAMGAAIQAALCKSDAAVADLVLTDVCPHTLGVETTREFGKDVHEKGYFEPIIDRNTTVPVSRSQVFHTLHSDQDKLKFSVYQGEARKVSENRLIGEIIVNNMRHRPGQHRPGEVDVRFSYDMNGILEVEITVFHNQQKISKVIQNRPGALSEEEIEETMKRLAPLKIHPRDKLENRARLERANRLFRELLGTQRDQLDYLLSKFEYALESQDVKEVNLATHSLDTFLTPFFTSDGEYDGSFLR